MQKAADIVIKTEFLQGYLKEKGLSESVFAERIGVAHSTVNRIINGKRNPGSKFIAGVLNNFNDLNFEQVFSHKPVLPKGNEKTSA
ncbi:helix-turn-helix transcriptional regulator [Bacillus infantis]|uniref:helix-turn-helix transcriptional regulator n=1 Tax=Bacillus infantis TaxID=324767 RepID=UPI00344D3BB1